MSLKSRIELRKDAFLIWLALRFKRRGAVAFNLYSMGELQFIRPILIRYAERNPKSLILIAHSRLTREEFDEAIPALKERVIHMSQAILWKISLSGIDLFLTSEQYNKGIDGVYSIATFHGQPAKAMTFQPGLLETFDALFLYGAIQRQAYDLFVEDFLDGQPPSHLELFNIGYPKSDDLINGVYSRDAVVRSLNLDPQKKTVLYAPAFNEGASLREFGPELIEILARQSEYNIVVKLPINVRYGLSDLYATGGVDWFEKIQHFESEFPNFHLYRDDTIDPILACADVLVTCMSSVGFEFMALNKPVVFIETPKFYTMHLPPIFPGRDTVSWSHRTSVNGGKEFGLVVSDIQELPEALKTVLANPDHFPRHQETLKQQLLYNPGRATEAAVDQIEDLLTRRVKTRRPRRLPGFWEYLFFGRARHRCMNFLNRSAKAIVRSLVDRLPFSLSLDIMSFCAGRAAQLSGAQRLRQMRDVIEEIQTLAKDRQRQIDSPSRPFIERYDYSQKEVLKRWVMNSASPWRSLSPEPLPFPGTLTEEDAQYLSYITRFYSGVGELVQLGPGLGLSTQHVMRAVSSNPHFQSKTLYIYDDFVWRSGWTDRHLTEVVSAPPNHANFLPLFETFVKSIRDKIQITKGKFVDSEEVKYLPPVKWIGRPIEMMIVDCGCTVQTNQGWYDQFSHSFVPDKTLIVMLNWRLHRKTSRKDFAQIRQFTEQHPCLELIHEVSDGRIATFLYQPESCS